MEIDVSKVSSQDIQTWMISHGEDAQVVVFFSVLVLLLVIEQLKPFRKLPAARWRRWMTNAGLTVTAIAVLPLLPVSLIVAGYWAEEQQIGLMNQLSLPLLLAVIIQLLLRGFISFFTHWLNHRVPLLWRLHRVHHLDTGIDVSSTVRFHPLEMPVSAMVGVPLVLVFGLSPWVLLMYELLDAAVVVFSHSNLKVPDRVNRWLSYIIVTPNLHRIHHSSFQPETDSNYSAVFPVWDVLFGTYRQHSRVPQDEMELGLSELRDERADSYLWLLLSPVRDLSEQAPAQPGVDQS